MYPNKNQRFPFKHANQVDSKLKGKREKKKTTSSETAAETGEILNLYKKRGKPRHHWETQACD